MNLLDKFVTLTAFSYSLNLFLLCFILVIARDFHRESNVKAALCILLAVIGAFLFHVVTGTTLILTLIGAGILALITDRVRKTGRTPRSETVALPVLAIIAAALRCLVPKLYFCHMVAITLEGLVFDASWTAFRAGEMKSLRRAWLSTAIAAYVGFFSFGLAGAYLFNFSRWLSQAWEASPIGPSGQEPSRHCFL